MSEQAVPYTVLNEEQSARWVFVRNREGRATNVRCLRGTTIIEVLHRGEKILVDIADFASIDLTIKSVYNRG